MGGEESTRPLHHLVYVGTLEGDVGDREEEAVGGQERGQEPIRAARRLVDLGGGDSV